MSCKKVRVMDFNEEKSVALRFRWRKTCAVWVNFGIGILFGVTFVATEDRWVNYLTHSDNSVIIMWATVGIFLAGLGLFYLVALLLNIIFWRCPACNKHMGYTGIRLDFCPRCGSKLS